MLEPSFNLKLCLVEYEFIRRRGKEYVEGEIPDEIKHDMAFFKGIQSIFWFFYPLCLSCLVIRIN